MEPYEDPETPKHRKKKIRGDYKLQCKYPALDKGWSTWAHYKTEDAAKQALKVLQAKNSWAEYRIPPA